jgi:hypothetical protein
MSESKKFSKFEKASRLITNLKRRQSIHSKSRKWRGRYKLISKHIFPDDSVIEFCYGGMVLRDYLDPTCAYQPSDLIDRNNDCLVVELNKNLPEDLQKNVFDSSLRWRTRVRRRRV